MVIGFPLLFPTIASAKDCHTGSACLLQQKQTVRPDYHGKLSPSPNDEVCFSVIANYPSGIVMAKGRVAPHESVDGRVVTSWRTQRHLWKNWVYKGQVMKHIFVRDVCISARKFPPVVTLCNEENRSTFDASVTAYIKRVKRVSQSNPACLLGKPTCHKYGL